MRRYRRHELLELLLFTDFAVVLAFAHLYTWFMVIPIFNSMMRIDHALLSAAADCGASDCQVVKAVIIPLSKPGMAIGSIFVVTLVMGDFVTVRLMSGGQSASVGPMMNQISLFAVPCRGRQRRHAPHRHAADRHRHGPHRGYP